MISKLKSRKLWATVIAGALVTIIQALGLDPHFSQQVVDLVLGYVVTQGVIDTVGLAKAKQE